MPNLHIGLQVEVRLGYVTPAAVYSRVHPPMCCSLCSVAQQDRLEEDRRIAEHNRQSADINLRRVEKQHAR